MGVQSDTLITTIVPADRVNSISGFMNTIDTDIISEIAKVTYNSNEYTGAKISISGTGIEAFIGYKSDDIHAELVYIKKYNTNDYSDYITYDSYDTETEYSEGDIVMYDGLCYTCVEETTGEWDSEKWSEFTNNIINDLAKYDGGYYKCIESYSGGWDSAKWIEMNVYLIEPTVAETLSTAAVGNISIYAYIHNKMVNDKEQKCMIFCINEMTNNKEGIEVSYIKTADDKFLVGYKLLNTDAGNTKFNDISTLSMQDINDISNTVYTYTNMFPYEASANTIDFLGHSYIVNGNNVKTYTVDILRECSTVTLCSTVSLIDKNYFAIGAHCLAPLDEE